MLAYTAVRNPRLEARLKREHAGKSHRPCSSCYLLAALDDADEQIARLTQQCEQLWAAGLRAADPPIAENDA